MPAKKGDIDIQKLKTTADAARDDADQTVAETIDLGALGDIPDATEAGLQMGGGPAKFALEKLQNIPLVFLESELRESADQWQPSDPKETRKFYVHCRFAFADTGKLGVFQTGSARVMDDLKRLTLPAKGRLIKYTTQTGRRSWKIAGANVEPDEA